MAEAVRIERAVIAWTEANLMHRAVHAPEAVSTDRLEARTSSSSNPWALAELMKRTKPVLDSIEKAGFNLVSRTHTIETAQMDGLTRCNLPSVLRNGIVGGGFSDGGCL